MTKLLTLLGALALLLPALPGCASITPIAYTPQPSRITDPSAEVRSLIQANTLGGCVAEPELSSTLLVVKFICRNAVGNSVVPFRRCTMGWGVLAGANAAMKPTSS